MSWIVIALLAFVVVVIAIIVVIIALSTSGTSTILSPFLVGTTTIASGPITITGGGQNLGSIPNPRAANPAATITAFSATLQNAAFPPTIGTTIGLHDGPTIFDPLIATLSTTNRAPTTVSTILTRQPTSPTLTVSSASGPSSSTDVGVASNIQIQVS